MYNVSILCQHSSGGAEGGPAGACVPAVNRCAPAGKPLRFTVPFCTPTVTNS